MALTTNFIKTHLIACPGHQVRQGSQLDQSAQCILRQQNDHVRRDVPVYRHELAQWKADGQDVTHHSSQE